MNTYLALRALLPWHHLTSPSLAQAPHLIPTKFKKIRWTQNSRIYPILWERPYLLIRPFQVVGRIGLGNEGVIDVKVPAHLPHTSFSAFLSRLRRSPQSINVMFRSWILVIESVSAWIGIFLMIRSRICNALTSRIRISNYHKGSSLLQKNTKNNLQFSSVSDPDPH